MAIPFPNDVVEAAWKRSGGYCECTRTTHDHNARRCSKPLVKQNRGPETNGAWEAHHINANGPAVLSNCQIMCWKCHKLTF